MVLIPFDGMKLSEDKPDFDEYFKTFPAFIVVYGWFFGKGGRWRAVATVFPHFNKKLD